jgi:hypothetical protein
MSTRERWIVYPLLFLTLGIVMRDKMVEMVHPVARLSNGEFAAEKIRCNQLQVDQIDCSRLHVDQAMNRLAVQGIECGELLVGGPNGRPTVVIGADVKNGGVIRTFSPTGVPLVLLQPTDAGGVVVASAFIRSVKPPQNTPATPAPKSPSKEPEKAPVKASK